MAAKPVRIGDLLFTLEGFDRTPDSNVPGTDELSVRATVENTSGRLEGTDRAPAAELRDEAGGAYEPVNLDETWYSERQPLTTSGATLRFRIPEAANGLQLVLAAGTDDEVIVDLELELTA